MFLPGLLATLAYAQQAPLPAGMIYYTVGGVIETLTAAEIADRVRSQVGPRHIVWKPGMVGWIPAGQLPEVAEALRTGATARTDVEMETWQFRPSSPAGERGLTPTHGTVPPPLPHEPTPRVEVARGRSSIAPPPPSALPDTPVFLSVMLNTMESAPILVYLRGSDVFARVEDLVTAGLRVEGGVVRDIRGERYVSLSSLAADVKWHVEERDLKLIIDASPTRLAGSTVNLARTQHPEGITYTQDSSAYVNYGVRTADFASLDLVGEVGVSVRNAVFYTGVTDRVGDLPVRGLSNVTVDVRERLQRLVLGDTLATGDPLGGTAFVGGVQYVRTSALDPYATTTASLDLNHPTDVLVPSTLEVYVNDQLARRIEVAPGPLDIVDIPITSGAGETRVVLKDALGGEREFTLGYYGVGGMLGEGEQEYSYTVGLLRREVGVSSGSYGGPAIMGLHRVGITPALALGVRTEGALDRVSGGVNVALGARLGEVEGALAGSLTDDTHGGAGSLAWAFVGRSASVSLHGQTMSDAYARLGLDPATDRASVEAGAVLGAIVAKRLSVYSAFDLRSMRDAGRAQRASVRIGVRLPLHVQLNLSGGWSRDAGAEDRYDASASASAPLGGRLSATLRGEGSGDEVAASAEVYQPAPLGSGVGFRASARADAARVSADAGADGQLAVGRAAATVGATGEALTGSLGVSGAVVFIGQRAFATPPVDGSFALVDLPDLPGVRTFLNGNEVGRTDRRGDILVTGLMPYYGNRLGISELDVPMGYEISNAERVVAPPPRGGARVRLLGDRTRLVRGRLVVPDANPAFGNLTVTADGVISSSPVGTGGEFEVSDVPFGHWRAEVRYPGGTCSAELDVPSTDAAVTELGAVPCTPIPKE